MTTLQGTPINNITNKLDCVLMLLTSMLCVFIHDDHISQKKINECILGKIRISQLYSHKKLPDLSTHQHANDNMKHQGHRLGHYILPRYIYLSFCILAIIFPY